MGWESPPLRGQPGQPARRRESGSRCAGRNHAGSSPGQRGNHPQERRVGQTGQAPAGKHR